MSLREAEVSGERRRLGLHSLHHVAVGGDDVGVVVDDGALLGVEARREHALGERHPDRVREALAEGAGRGLDAGGVAALRVAGRQGTPLAEALQVVRSRRRSP